MVVDRDESEIGVAPLLISVDAAADAIGVRRTTAWTLVRSGELASVRIGSRRLVPTEALREFVDRLQTEQGDPQ